MNFFSELFNSDVFYAAFLSWFIAQLLKVILTLFTSKKLDFYRFIGSGGMPSSHSSMVMGLSTAVGLKHGFSSDLFAVSFVFSMIIMYDASGVRRAVGKQAMILNQMIIDFYEKHEIREKALKELVGHTPVEVFAGAILGIFIANILI